MAFQCKYYVDCRHHFPVIVVAVCDNIFYHIFQENLHDTLHFFIDISQNPLYSTTSGKSTNCWSTNIMEGASQHCLSPLHLPFSLPFAFCRSCSTGVNSSLLSKLSEPVFLTLKIIEDHPSLHPLLLTQVSQSNVLKCSVHTTNVHDLWSSPNMLSPPYLRG